TLDGEQVFGRDPDLLSCPQSTQIFGGALFSQSFGKITTPRRLTKSNIPICVHDSIGGFDQDRCLDPVVKPATAFFLGPVPIMKSRDNLVRFKLFKRFLQSISSTRWETQIDRKANRF